MDQAQVFRNSTLQLGDAMGVSALEIGARGNGEAPLALTGELPTGERVPITGFGPGDASVPSSIELDARLLEALADGPVTTPVGNGGAIVLEAEGDRIAARLNGGDGDSRQLRSAESAPGPLRLEAPDTSVQRAGLGDAILDWLRPTVENKQPYRLEDANGNGMVDGKDRRNPAEEPVAPHKLAPQIPDNASVVLFGENHSYTEPVRDQIQAFVEHNRDVHDKQTIVIKELPESSFGDAMHKLNNMTLSTYGAPLSDHERDAFMRAWESAIEHWKQSTVETFGPLGRAAVALAGGLDAATIRADGKQLLDLRAAGAKIYAGAEYEASVDRTLMDKVEEARQQYPDAVIAVQTGFLHAQTEASETGDPDLVDRDNTLGMRLEERYGADDVHSMMFQPLNPRSYRGHQVPYNHYDQVVPTTIR